MDWDNLYIKHPEFCIKELAEEVVDFVPLLKKLPGSEKEKKVYDLGFGAGRHILYLARLGYKVYGDDISNSGKEITQKQLDKEGLKAKLGISDMTVIPYKHNFFDAIINRGVITHNTLDNIKKCISEMNRTIKVGGLVMTTFISTESSEYGKGKEIEHNTFVPDSGPEEGVPHHFVTKEEVEILMSSFEMMKLYNYKHKGLLKVGNYVSAHWIYFGRKI